MRAVQDFAEGAGTVTADAARTSDTKGMPAVGDGIAVDFPSGAEATIAVEARVAGKFPAGNGTAAV